MSFEEVIQKYEQLTAAERQKVDLLLEQLTVQKKNRVQEKHLSLFGVWKGQVKMSPDFDEPLEDFKAYME